MTLEQFRLAVRRLCGNPDTTEVTNDDIESFLTGESLTWLNTRRPGKALTHFETVDAQQEYDVKPANAYFVTDVFWKSAGLDVFSPSLRFTPDSLDMNSSLAGFNIVTNPMVVEAAFKNYMQYEENFSGRGYETEEGKIRLEPIPSSSGDDVYFFYDYPRWTVVTTIPAEYIEALKHDSASRVLEMMSIKRGLIRSGRDFSGGGGANEMKFADKYRERADALIPDNTAVIFKA